MTVSSYLLKPKVEKMCRSNSVNIFEKLYNDISVKMKIVPAKQVNFKRDAEYCLLLYSEEKDNYLISHHHFYYR